MASYGMVIIRQIMGTPYAIDGSGTNRELWDRDNPLCGSTADCIVTIAQPLRAVNQVRDLREARGERQKILNLLARITGWTSYVRTGSESRRLAERRSVAPRDAGLAGGGAGDRLPFSGHLRDRKSVV